MHSERLDVDRDVVAVRAGRIKRDDVLMSAPQQIMKQWIVSLHYRRPYLAGHVGGIYLLLLLSAHSTN